MVQNFDLLTEIQSLVRFLRIPNEIANYQVSNKAPNFSFDKNEGASTVFD